MKTLNRLAPYDWAGFFHTRLTSTSAEAPVGGSKNGGWKVMFNDKPMSWGDAAVILAMSIPSASTWAAMVWSTDAIVGSPAFEAGISSQMKIIGVNGRVFTQELLSDALKSAKGTSKPITLLVVVDDYFRTCTITYHDGARYPHLERVEGRPDYLDELIKPQVASH